LRLLYVTPRFPYPPLKGDQLIFFHRLRLLGKRHEIALLTFAEDESELDGTRQLAEFCSSIDTVVLPRWRSIANVATGAPLSRLPLQVLYFRSRAFRHRLEALLERERFDVVHAYFHRVTPFVEGLAVPTVLDLMDSMQLRAARNATHERWPKRLVWEEELRRVRAFERSVASRFARIVVVSDQDRDLIPGANVEVVPNGVDAAEFAPLATPRDPLAIAFSGNMSYEPNVHAIQWFADACFPRIRARVPQARLAIVGSNPARAVVDLGTRDGIEVTGFVESMARALNNATVAVAPMVSGSGIQNKILEAMACALPVVATTVGRGSIPAGELEGLITADVADAFADAVTSLLENQNLAHEVGRRGRAFVLERYSWERNAEAIERIYGDVTRDVTR
jgi:sugar transferase (PEP-CTERM/EpsH1 system associated)